MLLPVLWVFQYLQRCLKRSIEYCGFCPDTLVQQKHVLNLACVTNPIIIQRKNTYFDD